jgi:succinate-acetate transporter protein
MMQEVKWAHPGALGLAGFGFNTILLQIHNIGLITNVEPLLFGFFWGGLAQVIAGIIDGRRGDTFGLTAFTSYGLFWIGLSFMFLMKWLGVVELSVPGPGLAWTFVLWGIFTAYMTVGTFKISKVHIFVFASLTLLFGLLAAVFFGALSAKVAGVEGIFCGAAAVYGSAAVVLNATYGRWILPIGLLTK